MKDKLGNKGFVRRFHLILISLFLLIGIPYAKPYYRYYALLWHTGDTMKIETNSKNIKEKIMEYAKSKKVPLMKENLTVDIDKMTVKVKAHWNDKVDYFGYYQKKLTFSIDEEF
jgi:hypothetical protein